MKVNVRSVAALFTGMQLAGLVCMLSWSSTPPPIASFIWGTSVVILFPGDLLSTILIEKLFWRTGLSSTAMLVAEISVLIALNAVLWFGLFRVMRRFFPSGLSRANRIPSRIR